MSETGKRYDGSEIAIVGMAGRFPGAPDLEAFWRNLREGRESIRFFSREELERAGEDGARLDDPQYVPARPVLDGVELFDAGFFGMSPREASVVDPQHRLFLECASHALEDAGHDPERFPGTVSVFAGASFSNYLVHNLYENRPLMEGFGDFETTIHNVPDSLATLVGYKLNLRGACCGVQTFCSTSLVAVHMACQGLLGFECDMALAGGVTVYVPQESGYLFQEGSIVSPDGHCRAFDARAAGTVFGSGVGAVVLRRLLDALKDGDRVDAVIRGTAVNNDGSLKLSFAAPGVAGQAAVVVEALSAAGVDPDTIGMVEAHGTGTPLGDPAEVSALTKAFRRTTKRRRFCALGSVKTNVGHLDAAAGVAGLLKLVLSIQHREIPPSLHFEAPNPAIDFEASPFYVPTSLRDWPAGDAPRRGGVSAFGVGGTNAHVVVEEAPEPEPRPASRASQLLPLSARTPSALAAAASRLADHLEAHPEIDLGDVAFTLQAGRRAFDHRLFVVARDREEAVAALRAPEGLPAGRPERRDPPLVAVLGSDGESGDGADLAAAEALAARLRSWGLTFEATARAGELAAVTARLPPDPARLLVELGASGIRVGAPAEGDGRGPAHSGEEGLLRAIGALWLHGVAPAWAALHARGPRRVRLPGYPFERERHWVEPLEEEPAPARDPASWLYRPVWTPLWPAPEPEPGPIAPTLVFLDDGGLGARVVEELRARGTRVATVAAARGFSGDLRSGYTIDPSDGADYRRLFEALAGAGLTPGRILHLWSLDPSEGKASPAERFRRATERGFRSVLELVAAGGPRPLVLHVAGSGLFEVLGGEVLRPEAAPLVAAVRVAAQEDEGLRGSVIDLEPPFADDAVEALCAQLGLEEPEILLGRRRGRSWVQDFLPIAAEAAERFPSRAEPGGAVLITGGLGDVGFLIAAWLVRQGGAKLVLTSRTGLPPREEWAALLQSDAPTSPLSLRVRKVLALEGTGAEVLVVPADVTSVSDLELAVRKARERFGPLRGVVHAAGEMGDDTFAPIGALSRDACDRQFAPKVLGTVALAHALRDEAPAFCLLTASLSTVLGGRGYAAYAGANAFQDAFAAQAMRAGGAPWISVDFDHWQLAGREAGEIARRAAKEGAAMAPEEGMAVVERVLRLRQLSRVVVSTAPLAARLQFLSARRPSTPAPQVQPAPEATEAALLSLGPVEAAVVERHEPGREPELVAYVAFGAGEEPTVTELRRALRERLPGGPVPASFVVLDALPRAADGSVDRDALRRLDGRRGETAADGEPRTRHEKVVANLWKEALGVERVSVHDNFFDLGGHSLLSIRVLARLEKATGLRFDARDMIFQSLGQIAATCDERLAATERTAGAAAG
ncbi:MAG TPA: SDR family oxidoreductase [Vicinamibacteria bacterium]|nr:SDR family oxidoreductase [Vicinamibacteria bacterium]